MRVHVCSTNCTLLFGARVTIYFLPAWLGTAPKGEGMVTGLLEIANSGA